MYNHLEEAVAIRAMNNWPELRRAVFHERRDTTEPISTATALDRYFSRFTGTPHKLENKYYAMRNLYMGV